MANLKLTQYLVRLKFDDVERVKRSKDANKEAKKTRKRRNPLDPDFDSEEEYGSENGQPSEDGSDIEYDDGKGSSQEALSDGPQIDAEFGESELSELNEDLYGSEQGEEDMEDEEDVLSESQSEDP